ncbi:DUF1801 domain-containing protein [Microbacterium sp. TPD7012]|uniref:DUF1801 domain-containing protein n=1 Tax=Microbacterium sp. TPD7012 TaxID=2171975 RepID=UPI000D51113D|nr:DUF1801 domain-containing protein [Microbacterium sp. TPD7012]PVE98640.1 hypothetical protein DC434_00475 [Microbacterium sp. TPD7012]
MAEDTKNFTAEEREAMQAAAKEAKTKRSRAKKTPEEQRAEGEADLKEAIAKLSDDSDRKLATGLHELVSEVAPDLVPRTYYGMPAWGKDGKVVCFFQPASKFKVRYGTFGFEPISNLDDGTMWPTAYALLELTSANRKLLAERIRLAIS